MASPVVVGLVASTTSLTSPSDAGGALHAQVLGVDAVDRRERAAEHVVAAAELVRTLDRTVGGSSTTQMTLGSRRASTQIMHRGPSARLKQSSHSPIRSLTSRIAAARANASSSASRAVEGEPLGGALTDPGQLRQLGHEPLERRGLQALLRFWARRAARLGAPPAPPPGGRPPPSPPMPPMPRGRATRARSRASPPSSAPPSWPPHSSPMRRPSLTAASTRIGEHLGVVGVDGVGIDLDRLWTAEVSGHHHADHPAAGRGASTVSSLSASWAAIMSCGASSGPRLEQLLHVGLLGHQSGSSGSSGRQLLRVELCQARGRRGPRRTAPLP